MSIEGTYLNIIKAILDKPTINIIYSIKVQSFSSKIKNKTKLSIPTTPILHSMEIPVITLGKKRHFKGIQIEKEEVKLSPSADNMTLHTLPWTRLFELHRSTYVWIFFSKYVQQCMYTSHGWLNPRMQQAICKVICGFSTT